MLNQRQIEIFNAIMVQKSVTAAAVALRSSQPTVSRELREMEIDLGFDLFYRMGKRLTPTEQAFSLFDVVKRSFLGMAEINRVASAIHDYNATHLRVACIPAYAETIIPHTLRRMLDLSQRAHLVVHSLEETALHHYLTSQIFDVGLTEGIYDHVEAATEEIEVGDVVAVLPTGHPLCKKRTIEPHDFEGVDFVSFAQGDPYRSKLDTFFSNAQISRRYMLETTTAAAVCAMVAAGVGVSIINPLTATHYAGRGIELRPLTVRMPYRINLWRSLRTSRSLLTDEFILTLRDVIRDYVRKSRK